MKVLFITANFIGDAVRTTGVLSAYLKQHPEAKVTIACGPPAVSLFYSAPNLEKIIIIKKKKFSLHWFALWARCFLIRWDMVIDLRRTWVAHLLFSKKRTAFLKKQIEREYPSAIYLSAKDRGRALELLPKCQSLLFISPTTTKRAKEWSNEKFAKLVNKLTQASGLFKNYYVVLAARADEFDRLETLIAAIQTPHFIILKEDLLTVAAVIERCRFFIGCDSALMHIAAALDVPTLGLFGPTRVEDYAPKGRYAMTVRTDKSVEELRASVDDYETAGSLMESLPVDKVLAVVDKLWSSLPAEKKSCK